MRKDTAVWDVIIIGGGNAALCAAITAREAGAQKVLMLEAAPREWRGGNSQHTRNIRSMHDAPQDVLLESYPEEEYWQDLLKVTGGITNEKLARMVIRTTATCREWMRKHGVRFQPSLSGTLHLSRTNAFFMGGGRALVNAYFRSAENMGVQVRYESPVTALDIRDGRFQAALVGEERIEGRACVIASGGFESNLVWLREVWGRNERGEWPADNFIIRGTRFNQGAMLRFMMDAGADMIGEPSQSHCVAVDARSPLYDGGIVTRVDCVSLGIMVNRDAQRFYDEGEDFWPKRYAIWGRLVAMQPQQIGYSVIDSKPIGRFMPPVFPGEQADSIEELAAKLQLDPAALRKTVEDFNAACRPGSYDHTVLDDCRTDGLNPVKSHWALPLDKPPYYGFALRPGITFTYLSLKTDERAQVFFNGKAAPNIYAAGEIISGNVLGKGYTGGIGMAIGTTFGRIAGTEAARAARGEHPASLPQDATELAVTA
jgi:tricarballylate dehydrogenase